MVLMAAGDKNLFDELLPCFSSFSLKAFFLGATYFFAFSFQNFILISMHNFLIIGVVGGATKIRLIHQMLYGTVVVGVSECLSIADRCDLNLTDVAELLQRSGFESTIF